MKSLNNEECKVNQSLNQNELKDINNKLKRRKGIKSKQYIYYSWNNETTFLTNCVSNV